MAEELIAARHGVDEIRGSLGADSLGYLSMEGMLRAAEKDGAEVCTACWSNEQPVKLPRADTRQLGLFDKAVR
jgi:amidophosphoribosyltransferase